MYLWRAGVGHKPVECLVAAPTPNPACWLVEALNKRALARSTPVALRREQQAFCHAAFSQQGATGGVFATGEQQGAGRKALQVDPEGGDTSP